MTKVNRRAMAQLEESSVKELREVKKIWKEKRVTKLARLSSTAHYHVRRLAKNNKTTMSKILDHIINKYFTHQRLYEGDRQ